MTIRDEFQAPRLPVPPPTGSVAMDTWMRLITDTINALPPLSTFSYSTPNSNVSATPGTLGVNLDSASSSRFWIKDVGSGMTGWVTGSGTSTLAGASSGVYVPTLTNVANVSASSAYPSQWVRRGNTVVVSGVADVDPTAAASTQLGISLPVASALTLVANCCGVAAASGIAGQSAAILGDVTNDRAQMQWVAVDVTNQPMYYTFTYVVA